MSLIKNVRIHIKKIIITELCLTVFYLYFIILYNTKGMSHLQFSLVLVRSTQRA